MFLKVLKGIFYMAVGAALVYFLKDPIIAVAVGVVGIAIVEIINQKIIHK